MKIVVLGASGMLGYALHRSLHDAGRPVLGLLRDGMRARLPLSPTAGLRYAEGFDAWANPSALAQMLEQCRASVVINAAAVRPDAPIEQQVAVNATLPALLSALSVRQGFKLLHFSTDAVFDGIRGMRRETDMPTPAGVYAACKFLGEKPARGVLILRTSMVGLGLLPGPGLLDWFMEQTGSVAGRPDAVFSGLPVSAIANVLDRYILPALQEPMALDGIWHLAAAPIDKLSLLKLVRERWGLHDIDLVPEASPATDRSLDGTALSRRLDWQPPGWTDLIDELYTFTQRYGLGTNPRQISMEQSS